MQGKALRALLLLLLLLLAGCGRSLDVSVDSMNDGTVPAACSCAVIPAAGGADDLFQREIIAEITPAFTSHGMNIVQDASKADSITTVAFRNEGSKVFYDTVPGPGFGPMFGPGRTQQLVATVVNYFSLTLDTRAPGTDGAPGRQLWTTTLRMAAPTDNFHAVLRTMCRVLPRVIGTHSGGVKHWLVYYERGGGVEVSPR